MLIRESISYQTYNSTHVTIRSRCTFAIIRPRTSLSCVTISKETARGRAASTARNVNDTVVHGIKNQYRVFDDEPCRRLHNQSFFSYRIFFLQWHIFLDPAAALVNDHCQYKVLTLYVTPNFSIDIAVLKTWALSWAL
jgi:hypothetical protein